MMMVTVCAPRTVDMAVPAILRVVMVVIVVVVAVGPVDVGLGLVLAHLSLRLETAHCDHI